MKKGYIQIYTGDGKGKTTASFGLAIRAAGAGFKVYIAQFLKSGRYSEIKSLERFPEITVEQFGTGNFVKGKPSEEDMISARKGYATLCENLKNGQWDVVIAEEANVALMCGIFTEEQILKLMKAKPDHVELLLTGRGASEKMIEAADLVTEMKAVKHYYQQGVVARKGIEK